MTLGLGKFDQTGCGKPLNPWPIPRKANTLTTVPAALCFSKISFIACEYAHDVDEILSYFYAILEKHKAIRFILILERLSFDSKVIY